MASYRIIPVRKAYQVVAILSNGSTPSVPKPMRPTVGGARHRRHAGIGVHRWTIRRG